MSVELEDFDGADGGSSVRFRCERPSRYAAWLLADGRLVPARCGASNRCAYCAYQATIENALVVALDAERDGYPCVGMTLTTVDPQQDMAAFRRAVQDVIRLLRRRLGDDVGYLAMIEWTTGRGARSGGHRRVHAHVLLKRCSARAAEAVEGDVAVLWHRLTGATRVELRELRSAAGATAYLIHHHRKRDQSPPPGWSGKRFRPSRNYFGVPVVQLRAEAAMATRSKRLRRAARQLVEWEALDGAPPEVLDLELAAALVEAKWLSNGVRFVKLDRFGGFASVSRAGRPWIDEQGQVIECQRWSTGA